MSKCMICGREEETLEEEFGREVPVREHEGMMKCQKCLREYQRETGDDENEVVENNENKDWKKALTA